MTGNDDDTSSKQTGEDRYRAACAAVLGRLREQRGWSYREFGERVGRAHTSLYFVEHATTTPSIDLLDDVARACDLTLAALLAQIVEQLAGGTAGADTSLPAVLDAVALLDPRQRGEVLGFIAYLRFRDSGT